MKTNIRGCPTSQNVKHNETRDIQHQGTGAIVYELYKRNIEQLRSRLAEICEENQRVKVQIDSLLNKAMDGYAEVREFIKELDHVLGSMDTKHGEIAEHVNVAERNGERIITGKRPNATMKNVMRTAPEDYLLNGIPVQSKYCQAAEKSLSAVIDHLHQYEKINYGHNKELYEIPKDQYELIMQILSGDRSYEHYQAVLNKVKIIEQETGRPFTEIVLKGKTTYAEVQLTNIQKTLDAKEQDIQNEAGAQKKQVDSDRRKKQQTAKEEAKPSFEKATQNAALSALFSGSIELVAGIYRKCKEGKSLTQFTIEDWEELGIDTAKATAEGGISGYAIYAVTNYTRLPDNFGTPIASAGVSLCFGLLELKREAKQNPMTELEYQNRCNELFISAAMSALGAAAGEVLIPIPVLGPVIGSAIAGQITQHILAAANYAAANIASQNDTLREYCEYLQKIDLEQIRLNTQYISQSLVALESAESQDQINEILRNAVRNMGLPLVFGDSTMDEKMSDPNWVLTF